jgi:hypothetical protein
MNAQFVKESTVGPARRRFTLVSCPIVEIPIWLVKEL